MNTSSAEKLECPYCGLSHLFLRCHRVKAFEFDPNGEVSRVEFHAPALPPGTMTDLLLRGPVQP